MLLSLFDLLITCTCSVSRKRGISPFAQPTSDARLSRAGALDTIWLVDVYDLSQTRNSVGNNVWMISWWGCETRSGVGRIEMDHACPPLEVEVY